MARLTLFLLIFYVELFAMQRASSDLPIGVRTIEYQDEARNRPVVVELWYPTSHLGPLDEPHDKHWIYPKEVRNAPILKGKARYPLLLISHGHKGSRRDTSWLARSLVLSGYIVASIDHHGDTRFMNDPMSGLMFWNRPLDMSFFLDQMEQGEWKELIDFSRIGFIGYSLGGMTGIALGGGIAKNAQAALEKLNRYSIRKEILAQFDLSPALQSYKDPRIKAMLLLCPAAFGYNPDSLKAIQIPTALVVARGDEILPFQEHAKPLIRHLSPAKLKVLRKEISHFAFMNQASQTGKQHLHQALLQDSPSCSRKKVHQEISQFAIRFFSKSLKK